MRPANERRPNNNCSSFEHIYDLLIIHWKSSSNCNLYLLIWFLFLDRLVNKSCNLYCIVVYSICEFVPCSVADWGNGMSVVCRPRVQLFADAGKYGWRNGHESDSCTMRCSKYRTFIFTFYLYSKIFYSIGVWSFQCLAGSKSHVSGQTDGLRQLQCCCDAAYAMQIDSFTEAFNGWSATQFNTPLSSMRSDACHERLTPAGRSLYTIAHSARPLPKLTAEHIWLAIWEPTCFIIAVM